MFSCAPPISDFTVASSNALGRFIWPRTSMSIQNFVLASSQVATASSWRATRSGVATSEVGTGVGGTGDASSISKLARSSVSQSEKNCRLMIVSVPGGMDSQLPGRSVGPIHSSKFPSASQASSSLRMLPWLAIPSFTWKLR